MSDAISPDAIARDLRSKERAALQWLVDDSRTHPMSAMAFRMLARRGLMVFPEEGGQMSITPLGEQVAQILWPPKARPHKDKTS